MEPSSLNTEDVGAVEKASSHLDRLVGLRVTLADDGTKHGVIVATFLTHEGGKPTVYVVVSAPGRAFETAPISSYKLFEDRPELTEQQIELLKNRTSHNGNFVFVVKEVRRKYGLSLKDAKELCDKYA